MSSGFLLVSVNIKRWWHTRLCSSTDHLGNESKPLLFQLSFFTFLDHFFFPVRVQMTLNKTIPFVPINVPFHASAYLLSSHIWTRLGCLVNSFRKVTPNNVALAFHIIRRCILDIWRCDGESDCADDSDEVACSTSKYFTPVKAFNLNSLGTLWDYSRKKLLPRAFFTRSHVTYSPSWQSRATAIRLKRITLRLLTNSSFSLPGPCAVCSLPLGQCLTKSVKTHRPRWIIRPSDGATFVSQTRHWLDLAGLNLSEITQSNSSAFNWVRKSNVIEYFLWVRFISMADPRTSSNSFVRRSSNEFENRTLDVISRDKYISVPLFNN